MDFATRPAISNREDMAQDYKLEELPVEVPEDLIQKINHVFRKIYLTCYQKTKKWVIKFKEFPPFDDVLREVLSTSALSSIQSSIVKVTLNNSEMNDNDDCLNKTSIIANENSELFTQEKGSATLDEKVVFGWCC